MAYIIRRVMLFIVTVALVSLITFAVFQVMPGDPIRIMLGPDADEAQIATLKAQLGLDQPLHTQYFEWIKGLMTGDLGQSIRFSKPVSELILDRLPVTISLAIMTLTIVVVVAIPLGIFVAKRQNKLSDVVFSTVT